MSAKTCDYCGDPIGGSYSRVHSAEPGEIEGLFHVDCWREAWKKIHPNDNILEPPPRRAARIGHEGTLK
jgi:hypothetical protein